jgi:hypothetical protein
MRDSRIPGPGAYDSLGRNTLEDGHGYHFGKAESRKDKFSPPGPG